MDGAVLVTANHCAVACSMQDGVDSGSGERKEGRAGGQEPRGSTQMLAWDSCHLDEYPLLIQLL